ncbi:uncharacterized protein LOC133639415 [Entelurus aequoreus]|uniref:uncharacterized protein LOC133639415 n=1 Tax=Entelurus aequoreus TaxID=161455 RepID=UPI002B1D2D6F|nr:uncharacterized protein LOC133639415 [Entelurus aequoreus]
MQIPITDQQVPEDGGQALLWNKEVKRTRLDWTTHTKYSVLCSEHFERSCFEEGPLRMAEMGISTRRLVLKKGAKPTIFDRPRTSPEHPTPSTSGQTGHMRSAFAKRERKRTIDQIMDSTTTASVADAVDEPMAMALDLPDEEGDQDQGNTREQGCQTDWVPIGTAPTAMTSSKSTQTGKIHHRSKGHQVTPEILERVRARPARVSEVPLSSVAAPSDSPEMQTNIAAPGVSGMQAKLRPPPAWFDEGPASSPTAPFVGGSSDDSYVPSESTTSDPCQSDGSPDRPCTHQMREEGCHKEPKYIIFESCLQSLVKWCHCPVCGSQDISPSWDSNGTQLTMTLQCASCDQRSSWSSQPNIGPYAAGNILLSAGILFAGASSGKVLQVLNSIGVVTYVKRTFFNHQELILQPAIKKVWEEQQRTHLTMLQVEGRPLVLGGDGRADSPGHSAKFGTYTTMELVANVVLDLQVVQSNECLGSYHMEMEGLKRMVELLISWDLDVGVLVTDRHRQIAKWIRENMPNTRHCYDIWHVAKSIGKKLKAIAKHKDCEDLKPWVQSIINHLYWAAVSTPPGEGELLVAKWKSVERHIQNIHKDHGDLFPICTHGQLQRQKKWLKQSSRSAVKLEEVVNNKSLLKDIAMLSGEHQTSKVEAFHSLIIQFAPKMYVFSYIGMLCRNLLAGLHWNENSSRPIATTQAGAERYAVRYPKYKAGGHVVKKIATEPTYRYVDDLIREVVAGCRQTPDERTPLSVTVDVPPFLCDELEKPDKEEAIAKHRSRFGKCEMPSR